MEDTIADLHYIAGYAQMIRTQLMRGGKPLIGCVNRMVELVDKVQRSLAMPKPDEAGN